MGRDALGITIFSVTSCPFIVPYIYEERQTQDKGDEALKYALYSLPV